MTRAVVERRAAGILFNLLRTLSPVGPFLLPANVCATVPFTFRKAGVPFELLDVSAQTLCLDEETVLARLAREPRPAGVLFVRTYGATFDAEGFFRSLKGGSTGSKDSSAPVAAPLLLVDDRCLATPELEPSGSAADVVLFSTGRAKPVDLAGGGYAFLSDDVDYRRHELPFSPADLERIESAPKPVLARNGRWSAPDGDWLDLGPPATGFDELRDKIVGHLARVEPHRAALNAIYERRVPAEASLAAAFQRWRFHLRVPERDRLLQEIFRDGLFASAHYPDLSPLFGRPRAPFVSKLATEVLNLFNDLHFDERRAERVAELVVRHLERSGGGKESR